MQNFLKKYNLTPRRIFWHALFWICFVAAHTLFYGYPDGAYREEFALALRYLPFKMLVTYFTLYFILPEYLLKKKYVRAFLFFVAAVAGGTILQQAVDYTILVPVFSPHWEKEYLFYFSKMFKVFLGMYPVVTIAAFIKLAKLWYEKDRQTQELKQQKLEAELNFLKAQIHPHFLFNTLNNLYALTLKKSDESPEVVVKLSELLSFILYECNTDTISLKKEIKILDNYIDLEKIRYDDRLSLDFQKNIDMESQPIPPMLLLPFVENAFKHGVSTEVEETWISIKLRVQNSVLEFSIENPNTNGQNAEQEYQKGIGLENVKRRLDLLYNGYYTLDIQEGERTYCISLKLELDKLQQEKEPE